MNTKQHNIPQRQYVVDRYTFGEVFLDYKMQIHKICAIGLYLNIDGARHRFTHVAPSTNYLRSHRSCSDYVIGEYRSQCLQSFVPLRFDFCVPKDQVKETLGNSLENFKITAKMSSFRCPQYGAEFATSISFLFLVAYETVTWWTIVRK